MHVIINDIEYVPLRSNSLDKSLLSTLDLRFNSDAGENITIRDYLYTLLTKVWNEGEGFNGKRPFGNSCWEYELYKPLVESGLVAGNIDEEGFVEDVDCDKANVIVFNLISAVFYGVENE